MASRPSSTATPKTTSTMDRDVLVSNGPQDSISDLCWSSQANHLAVSSWDNYVRIYDHTQAPSGVGISSITFDAPVLSCHFSQNGQVVVGGSVDKTARLIDLAANGSPPQQVAVHENAVKTVRFFEAPQSNATMLATASWDKTIKFWDLRTSAPAATLNLPERVYSMDIKGQNLVATTPERKIYYVDLTNPTTFAKIVESKVQKQPRMIIAMSREKGYAVASVEARCEIGYFEAKNQEKNFTFRCHRHDRAGGGNNADVFAVNAVNEHPTIPGVYSTAGADGTMSFWDVPRRRRLTHFPNVGHAISATAFNADGTIFAYAVSYDWSKGYGFHTPDYPHKVMLHPVGDDCKTDKSK